MPVDGSRWMRHTSFMNIAHRGASAYAPENTLATFDKALDLGAGNVEFDVHFSADGHVVVIHDDTVDRTTNGAGAVASLSLKQLKRLDAGSWFAAQFSGERIPTLEELLERYKSRLHFHIEVKGQAEHLSEKTIDLVRGYGWLGSVTITSFQKERLEEAKAYAPEIPVGWLAREVDEPMVEQARRMGLAEVCPHADFLNGDLLERLHQMGFMVSAWGVRDEEVMRSIVEAGADGIIIDFPDKLASYLNSRPARRPLD